MAKEDIPIQESTQGGVPVTDVVSAQRAIQQSLMGTPKEQTPEDEVKYWPSNAKKLKKN
jgi:hypothetical protein